MSNDPDRARREQERRERERRDRDRERDRVERDRLEQERLRKLLARRREEEGLKAAQDRAADQRMKDLLQSQGLDEFGRPVSAGAEPPAPPRSGLTVLKCSGAYPVETHMNLKIDLVGDLEIEHPEIDDLRTSWLPNPGGPGRTFFLGVRWPAHGIWVRAALEDFTPTWRRFVVNGVACPLQVRTQDPYGTIGLRWLPPSTTRATPDEASAPAPPPATPPAPPLQSASSSPGVSSSGSGVADAVAQAGVLAVVGAVTWGLDRWRRRKRP